MGHQRREASALSIPVNPNRRKCSPRPDASASGQRAAVTTMNAGAEAVELLAASAGEQLLVTGFDPGVGLEILARLCPDTMITGVDPSAAMLRSAVRRNGAVITAGKMTLHRTPVAGLETPACGFDAAVAAHTLQFFGPFEDGAIAYRSGQLLAF
jgi:hypothetical protein